MDKIKVVRRIAIATSLITVFCLITLELWDSYKPREYLVWDSKTLSVVRKQQSNKKNEIFLQAQNSGYVVEENIKFYAQVEQKIDWQSLLETILNFTKGCVADKSPQPTPTNPPPVGNYPNQQIDWGMTKIQAIEAQNITRGKGIKVCILDTGLSGHPDLKTASGVNFTGQGRGFEDNFGHGTHVAGIIAALSNEIGSVGVAPDVTLIIGKVLGDDGSGSLEGIANGIKWCADQNANIINMSLGGGGPTQIMYQALLYASQKGLVIVAAAGNDSGPVNYPAAFSTQIQNIIAVSATDINDQITDFSSRGNELVASGPGKDIYSTVPITPGICKICNGQSGWSKMSGTSMATPYVSGVLALAMSKNKQLGLDQIGPKYLYGNGRVNALKSVQ